MFQCLIAPYCTYLVFHLELLRACVFVCILRALQKKKKKLTWLYLQNEIGGSVSSKTAMQTPSVMIRRVKYRLSGDGSGNERSAIHYQLHLELDL